MFLPGAIQCVAAMLWWLLELAARSGILSLPVADALPGSAAHIWLMLYGCFPFFIYGFLYTAVPSWLNASRPTRNAYLAAVIPMSLGAALFYPGLYVQGLAAVAVGLHLIGWIAAWRALWRIRSVAPTPASARRSALGLIQAAAAPLPDRRHARVALLACALGGLGEAAYLLWLLLGGTASLLTVAEVLGVWGFLAPLYLAVCHRMIPWFTSRAVANYTLAQPSEVLWLLVSGCLLHGGLEMAGLAAWNWPADLGMAGLCFWLCHRWQFSRGLAVRMLAMLHIGFLWAGLAFLLYGLQGVFAFAGLYYGLGHAPLHALGIGFFASMLIGMATRVSLGHTGRTMEANALTWGLFWLVQATAVLRLAPELLPIGIWSTLVAGVLWLLAFGAWTLKYAPWTWQARVDGRPG